MPDSDPLDDKRREAQAAMEDEAHKAARQAKVAEQEKKRILARQAMEGEERRQRRMAKERIERDRLLEAQGIKAATEAEIKAKADAAQAASEAQARNEADQAAAHAKKVESIAESEGIIEKLKTKELNLSPIRTFKSDMARAVQEEGVSISKIALSEQARGRLGAKADAPKPRRSPWLLVVMLIVVLAAAGGGAYWWFIYMPAHPAVTAPNPDALVVPNSLIFTEKSKAIALAGNPTELLQKITKEIDANLPAGGTVENIYFTKNKEVQGFTAVRESLSLVMPDPLIRSLTDQFMFGVTATTNEPARFLVLKTRDYSLAYAALLSWETSITESLLPLLRGSSPTGSERTAVFTDRLILNKDVRILRVGTGSTILLYTFLDPQTILITQNEAAFQEIFTRYANSSDNQRVSLLD